MVIMCLYDNEVYHNITVHCTHTYIDACKMYLLAAHIYLCAHIHNKCTHASGHSQHMHICTYVLTYNASAPDKDQVVS